MSDGDTYFRNYLESICLKFIEDEHVIVCSVEGNINHILASRMSSRPIGWKWILILLIKHSLGLKYGEVMIH